MEMLFSKDKSTEAKGKDAGVSPGGLGGIINGMFQSLFANDKGGGNKDMPGLNYLGDFDVNSFVEGTLAKNRGGNNDGLKELIGSLMKVLGGGGG